MYTPCHFLLFLVFIYGLRVCNKHLYIDKHICHSDKARFVWDNTTDTDVAHYKKLTAEYFIKLKISDVIHCSNINCDSIEHHNQIDELYMKMCSIMMQCSSSSIPTSKVKTSGDYVVPGFNEYPKELHKEARSCFIAWKSLGKPRAGLCYTDMRQSRLRFKSVLKHCQRMKIPYALMHLPNLIFFFFIIIFFLINILFRNISSLRFHNGLTHF